MLQIYLYKLCGECRILFKEYINKVELPCFLQLQQVVDSFIIFASQQTETESSTEHIELPSSNSFNKSSSLKLPWTKFSPSEIRIAPFPTREYTDDQFQSIIKRVMGVLYVFLPLRFQSFSIIFVNQDCFFVFLDLHEQVSFGISLPNLWPYQLFCVREGLVMTMIVSIKFTLYLYDFLAFVVSFLILTFLNREMRSQCQCLFSVHP